MEDDELDLSEEENLLEYYEEFDTLIHCTTFENAAEIIKHKFKPQLVSDSSVANVDLRLDDMRREGITIKTLDHQTQYSQRTFK